MFDPIFPNSSPGTVKNYGFDENIDRFLYLSVCFQLVGKNYVNKISYMKNFLVIPFILLTQVGISQKLKKSDRVVVAELQKHIGAVANGAIDKNSAYIIEGFSNVGLKAALGDQFVHEFSVFRELSTDSSCLFSVNGKKMEVEKEFFPLAYSALSTVEAEVTPDLKESGMPWFASVQEVMAGKEVHSLDEMNSHIREVASNVKRNGGNGLIIYGDNSNGFIGFDKNDTSQKVDIPVVYVTKSGWESHFSGNEIAYEIKLNPQIKKKYDHFSTIGGLVDNGGGDSRLFFASVSNSIAALLIFAKLVKAEAVPGKSVFLVLPSGELKDVAVKRFVKNLGIDVGKSIDFDTFFINSSDANNTYRELRKLVSDLKDEELK